MSSGVRIRRSRGAVCGAALILLGLWGGIAPFIGHYLHFGYTPDKAWAYTSGRLYFSAIPGAAALVGGLMVVIARQRVLGVIGGVLAALGGVWFLVGSGVTLYLLKQTSIAAGIPMGAASTAGPFTVREYLEVLALFGGLGTLIVFFGALACGRMSMVTASDVAAAEADGSYYPEYPASAGAGQTDPASTGQFPTTPEYPGPSTGQFPTVTGQFPGSSGQLTRPSSFRRAPDEYPGPAT